MIGALLAAGVEPLQAAGAAAWLHADAARRGPRRGLVAGDVVDLVPAALAALGGA
jgi:NAD(P)H-hydrate repair Nnr-like enzyme with NAD(P)H-hydrate dehydratase domain